MRYHGNSIIVFIISYILLLMLLKYKLRKRSCALSRWHHIALPLIHVVRGLLNIVLIELTLRQIFIMLFLPLLHNPPSPCTHVASRVLRLKTGLLLLLPFNMRYLVC